MALEYLNIKNSYLKNMIELYNSVDKEDTNKYGKLILDCPIMILLGYLDSFTDVVYQNGTLIDLTYDTLKDVIESLASFTEFQKQYYNERDNIAMIEKTLASYFTLLAVNEENCEVFFKSSYGQDADKRKLWADELMIRLKCKGVRVSDFLANCIEKIQINGNEVTIDPEEVSCAYKTLTGVDLDNYA